MYTGINSTEDQAFMSELYTSKYTLWYKTAYNLTLNEEDAKDAVQESFLKLQKKVTNLRNYDCYTLQAYVVTTIANTCKTFLKKKAKVGTLVDYYNEDNLAQLKSDFSTEYEVFYKLDIELLKKEMRKLNPTEQLLIYHTYHNKFSDRKIAEILDLKFNNIRTYRCRILQKLRKKCRKESED